MCLNNVVLKCYVLIINFQEIDGMYNYWSRDRLLVVGDTVVDCNMLYAEREIENTAYPWIFENAGRVLTVPTSGI